MDVSEIVIVSIWNYSALDDVYTLRVFGAYRL